MKQLYCVCMILDSQQVVQSHLGEELGNVYSKQTSSTVCIEKCIPKACSGAHGKLSWLSPSTLGTDEFSERRTITKKDLEIAGKNFRESISWQFLYYTFTCGL